jgi:hypothetical protein
MVLPLMAFAAKLPRHDFSQITAEQALLIRTWYWLAVFSRRYSSAGQTYALEDAQALEKAATGDYAGIVGIIQRIQPVIRNADDLLVIHKKYDAVYKGILDLVNYDTGGFLNFENGNPVSMASSLEDHHIFPADYLKKNWTYVHETLDSEVAIDCVVNRTLIPKLTNIKVSNKPPSKYLGEIKAKNPKISDALQSHMLREELLTGDYDRNYDFFLVERAEAILGAIARHLTGPRAGLIPASPAPSKRDGRISEAEVGFAVLKILANSPGGTASVDLLKNELPNHVELSEVDQSHSDTRPNEQIWEQQIRNLKSHDSTDGNLFKEGFIEQASKGVWRITDAGRLHLENGGGTSA